MPSASGHHEGVTKPGRVRREPPDRVAVPSFRHDDRPAGCRADLPGPHLRLPDERARLRAALRTAGGRRLHRRARGGRRGRRRPQHLRGAGERRQPALRQPRPPPAGQGRPPRHADRRRRLPGAEGPRRDRPPGAVGGRRLRHPQRRVAAGAAGAGAAQRRGAGRDRRGPRGLPVDAAGQARLRLLRQNVNAYGVEFRDRGAFADLLRATGAIAGLERVRFTSPHPREFTDDVIEAMAGTPAVCHQLHMPLQSGSDDVLRRMRRGYRRDRYLGIIDRVRAAMPDAAITTDVIVGFPGETEQDFQDTLDVVRQARFASAFTFQYSKRPGTPAAEMDGQLPKAVVQERYLRLTALQDEISWAENRALTSTTVELLVAAGEGSKDAVRGRLSGRARDGRLVHFTAADGVRAGDIVETVVTQAAPHHLVADGPLLSHRRTRAGDAGEVGTRPSTPGVLLGMPKIGAPA